MPSHAGIRREPDAPGRIGSGPGARRTGPPPRPPARRAICTGSRAPDALGAMLARAVTERQADAYAAAAPASIPTYDTKKEAWAVADARGADVPAQDHRRFGQADASPERQRSVFMAVGAVETIEDVDALELAQIQDIDPQSIVPYRILHDVLHQSWHVAKSLLLDPRALHADKRRALMAKLWEYRQWHHQKILEEVALELNRRKGDAKALLASAGGGSATLSSDIDVNLKGNHTELAVPLFNARFRHSTSLPAHRWDNEPGVVYDVNVYAIDFMHKYGTVAAGDRQVTLKEGAHAGRKTGGIADEALAETDRHNQLVTALFKARLFMDDAQWAAYQRLILSGLPGDAVASHTLAFRDADTRFAGYLAAMAAQMRIGLAAGAGRSGVDRLKAAAATLAPGHDHAAEAAQENVLMTAANRIYERKLYVIHGEREELKARVTQIERADVSPQLKAVWQRQLDQRLLALRALIAEAAMYANEASMTDATVHHVVVGLQGGKEIDQQKSEGINAVHENLADAMKEVGRYPGWTGVYKAGKYLMRLADAGRNLGFGYVWGVQVLYDLGHKLSEDIKKRADAPGSTIDVAVEALAAVREITGRQTLEQLLELAMETSAEITREYSQERAAHTRAGEADTKTAYGHRTGKKGTRNIHLLNQGMVHPADREKHGTVSEVEQARKDGVLDDFVFRLHPEELALLQDTWAGKR